MFAKSFVVDSTAYERLKCGAYKIIQCTVNDDEINLNTPVYLPLYKPVVPPSIPRKSNA
jgi:hypothetical protein